ncbi:MAG TPA: NAD-dependent epimerase, partial [Anaeromyxobacteraceae bacterium]|nr:NAD-dependent epimerase [Anaeromyxobacteraceae bacterium]
RGGPARAGRPVAFFYTGSPGGFGQGGGGEVDEETPPLAASPASAVLREAELLVTGAAGPRLRSMVIRLSGLYGPGREWPVERVRAGRIALGPGDGAWLNLLHRDDAVAAVEAVLERGRAGAIYHGTDAEPVRRADLVRWVAARLGIAPPRLPDGAEASSVPDRRVRGDRTRAELGLRLRYPTFREGLAA